MIERKGWLKKLEVKHMHHLNTVINYRNVVFFKGHFISIFNYNNYLKKTTAAT